MRLTKEQLHGVAVDPPKAEGFLFAAFETSHWRSGVCRRPLAEDGTGSSRARRPVVGLPREHSTVRPALHKHPERLNFGEVHRPDRANGPGGFVPACRPRHTGERG